MLQYLLITVLNNLIPSAVVSWGAALAAQHLIHIFQLESYKRPQFFQHIREDGPMRRRLLRFWLVTAVLQAAVFFAACYLSLDESAFPAVTAAVFLAGMFVYYVIWKNEPFKKPLKRTARVVRLDVSLFVTLLIFQAIIAAILFALFALASTILASAGLLNPNAPASQSSIFTMLIFEYLLPLLLPFLYVLVPQCFIVPMLPRFTALASAIAEPVENAVKRWYFNDARKKLAGFPDMIRIGITGSYGKTSAKAILSTILSEKYKTYATPHSYNTPMGVTRADARAAGRQLRRIHRRDGRAAGRRHRGDVPPRAAPIRPAHKRGAAAPGDVQDAGERGEDEV